jgi:hypothetical protein
MSEPITPELVLVDPDLARRERARLLQRAPSEALLGAAVGRQKALPPKPLPREPPPHRHRGALARGSVRRFALFACCLIGLLAIGVFLALRLPGERGERGEQKALALPEVTSRSAPGGAVGHAPSASDSTTDGSGSSTAPRRPATTSSQRSSLSPRARRAPTRGKEPKTTTPNPRKKAVAGSKLSLETQGAVERKILALVVQSPAGKLPQALIDQKTGLAKNNLQALCRRTSNSRSFRCVVKSAVDASAGRVYVYYRMTHDGRVRVTWSRVRRG